MLTGDERFSIPAYMGHNGWIQLDVQESCDWEEVRGLALESYRHFALKRMLAVLDGPPLKPEPRTKTRTRAKRKS